MKLYMRRIIAMVIAITICAFAQASAEDLFPVLAGVSWGYSSERVMSVLGSTRMHNGSERIGYLEYDIPFGEEDATTQLFFVDDKLTEIMFLIFPTTEYYGSALVEALFDEYGEPKSKSEGEYKWAIGGETQLTARYNTSAITLIFEHVSDDKTESNRLAPSNTTPFDYSDLLHLSKFSYTDGEGEWMCYVSHVKQFTDASVVFGLQAEGNDLGYLNAPFVYIWMQDNDNNPYADVLGLKVIVDGIVYSYETMQLADSMSYVYLGKYNGMYLIEALADAETVKLEIRTADYIYNIELEDKEAVEEIAYFSGVFSSGDAWENMRWEGIKEWERLYPLTVYRAE